METQREKSTNGIPPWMLKYGNYPVRCERMDVRMFKSSDWQGKNEGGKAKQEVQSIR